MTEQAPLPSAPSEDRVTLILQGVQSGAEEALRQHGFYRSGQNDLLWLNNAIDAVEGTLDGARHALRLLRDEAKEQRRLRKLARAAAKAERRSA